MQSACMAVLLPHACTCMLVQSLDYIASRICTNPNVNDTHPTMKITPHPIFCSTPPVHVHWGFAPLGFARLATTFGRITHHAPTHCICECIPPDNAPTHARRSHGLLGGWAHNSNGPYARARLHAGCVTHACVCNMYVNAMHVCSSALRVFPPTCTMSIDAPGNACARPASSSSCMCMCKFWKFLHEPCREG